MFKINKFSIATIIGTFGIVIFSTFNYLTEKELAEKRIKINTEEVSYEVLFNPYYLNKLSSTGTIDILNTKGFFSDKNLYVLAQKEFDNNNYEKALEYLTKIESLQFNPIKFDLMGDIYYYKKDFAKSIYNYESAIKNTDKENTVLIEIIFSKLQKAIQDSY